MNKNYFYFNYSHAGEPCTPGRTSILLRLLGFLGFFPGDSGYESRYQVRPASVDLCICAKNDGFCSNAAHAHTHTHKHTHIHTCTHMRAHTHTHTHMHTQAQTRIHTYRLNCYVDCIATKTGLLFGLNSTRRVVMRAEVLQGLDYEH